MSRFFDHLTNIADVKAEYKRLAKLHHPDVGGDTATMQAVNAQYADAIHRIQRGGEHPSPASATASSRQRADVPEEFIAVINAVIGLHGVDLDLVGDWLWATGNTYPNRDALKAAGFRFASKKRAWYWHPADAAMSRASRKSLDEIKDKYGSERISGAAPRILTA